eukprot:2772871-Rhodomonas_salina.1
MSELAASEKVFLRINRQSLGSLASGDAAGQARLADPSDSGTHCATGKVQHAKGGAVYGGQNAQAT